MIVRTAAALAVALIVLGPARASDDSGAPASHPPSPFSIEQENAIRDIVRGYLVDNPEVIVEAIEALRARQQQEEKQAVRQSVAANAAELFEDPEAPVMGNPDGDVTIVEFLDYRCPYCKQVFPGLMSVVEQDGNIRLVLKEFPILGPESRFAARAALAAREQDKYADLHVKLMSAKGELTEDAVVAIAQSVGIDVEQLREDMEAQVIDEVLQRNFKLAERLSIRGTPAFIIGDELVPGAIGADQLRRIVDDQREHAG